MPVAYLAFGQHLDTSSLEEMGWSAKLGIEEMCASSWKWQSMNPNGYKN